MSEYDAVSDPHGWLPDFSRREIRIAAILFLYNFGVMCAFSVIKPVRNTLLLEHLGPDWLPVGFIGAAIVTGLVVSSVGWMADRVPVRIRVLLTVSFLILNLLAFRWLFAHAGNWAFLAFYIWANLFSNILITQFWLVAGNLFTAREAKRLFGWVGAGGILGAVVGPTVVFRIAGTIRTENLLYLPCGLLILCLPMIWKLESGGGKPESTDADTPTGGGLKLLREFRHLKLIALISGVSLIVQTVLDYQFQTIVAHAFVSEAAKTAFFAKFFAVQNLAGFVFQVALTRVVLNRFGVGMALLMLPLALCGGSLGILANPTLWVAVTARLTEGGLRYSLEQATREILYLPLPSEVRSQARPLIDIFGARLFEGLAGLLILGCTAFLHLSPGELAWISIGLILVWTVAVLAVKREYLDALRTLFSDVQAHSHDRAAEVLDRETVGMLIENLKAQDEIQVCQALAMLDLVHDKEALVPHLKRLSAHPSPAVRGWSLRLLAGAGVGGHTREAEGLLSASDPDVRVQAVRYLCRFGEAADRVRAATLLRDGDARVRTAAIASLAGSKGLRKGEVRSALEDLCRDRSAGSEGIRAEAALVLGTLNEPEYDDLLVELLRDPSPEVARAALEGIERTGRRAFVPHAVPHLADERLVIYAQRALKAYGDRILGTLRDYMDDPGEPVAVRRGIPGCFAAIGTQRAARLLTDALEAHGREFGDAIVEALGEMRNRHPELAFDAGKIEAALLREVEAPLQPRRRGATTDKHLGRAMGLLALIYPIEDIYRAYAGLKSENRELRHNAIELLDNLIRPELKRAVLPYIEAWAPPDTGL